ncbi:hypothetical protein LR48_Vigan07g008700 [Vigna angularis]|uniref:Uncharacterized protein n=2 Tax=Phaseolus angularis TaxID=3914 RepID=A0A0L9UUE7_PHAAN|nr:hypothetical protein LR48_Vigan07g008700 [Vigna angularis]BAT90022.1 hypothetical protein VIGAN_06118500 [Vigna angularis var. angularis]
MKLQLILLAEKKHKHPPYGPAAGPAVGGSSSHVYTSKCHGWKQRMLVEEKHTDTNKNGGALTLFSHGQVNYFLTAKNARKRCSLKDKEASREELQNRAIKKQAAEKEQGGRSPAESAGPRAGQGAGIRFSEFWSVETVSSRRSWRKKESCH